MERIARLSLTFVSVPAEAELPEIVGTLLGLMTGSVLASSPTEAFAAPGRVVVLIDPPEVELAGLVAAGRSLAQATGLWAERTEALLGLLRRHRRRLLVQSALEKPGGQW